ncbi:MAG: tripartite tricarboxylate transporter substrate binding protein [Betaproteobacteria bacterium]|nr:tripartite tricarboxylate transporter substrate binding protein [Betaproteobacteria bacterium]
MEPWRTLKEYPASQYLRGIIKGLSILHEKAGGMEPAEYGLRDFDNGQVLELIPRIRVHLFYQGGFMPVPRFAVWMFSVGMMVLGAGVVSGQEFPNKPIRMVTSPPGGGADFASRLIAQGLSGPLGQQVIVDNRGGIIPMEIVSKAPPDGYTLLLSASLWLTPLLQNTPYDPVRDFSPITLVGNSPNVLVVHPSLPVKSVKELIALAKARPGELNYASGATGASTHLAAESFKSMAGVDIARIPYKGNGPALNALIGGQVQLMFATAGSVTPHLKSGRLKGLAVTSARPSALAPGLPAVTTSGLAGYESAAPYGIFAPAGTPATLINRLNQEIVRVLKQADVKDRFFNSGIEIVGSSPEGLAATVKSEMARSGKVIKDAGIRAE